MITNNQNIDISLAAWLMHDDYDYVNQENYISTTSLLKSVRQIVLGYRLDKSKDIDVTDLVASRLGSAIHDSLEKVWTKIPSRELKRLGYPDSVIDNIVINPTEPMKDKQIPIYLEQRKIRELGKWKIGGKYDLVLDGMLYDHKTTSVYTWIYGSRIKDYVLQGSIYRWLNPEVIKEDFMRINFIFTDWKKNEAATNPKYPPTRILTEQYELMSLAETEKWITDKLNQLEKYMDSPQSEIPECTREELWMGDAVYKYYSDPSKIGGRATKNFTSLLEANIYKQEKGKGEVVIVNPIPKACEYCPVFDICEQRRKWFND